MIGGEIMLAEIYNKISKTGSNLSDRLEDELTGNIFGTLRYIPFNDGLKKILTNAVYPSSIVGIIEKIQSDEWNSKIHFWPYDSEGELDVYLEFDDVVIGIEVKYHSGISSDDGADYSNNDDTEKEMMNSSHQLQREARIVSRKGIGKQKVLLFIADSMSCVDVYENMHKRKLMCKNDVVFGYISWQSFLRELRKLKYDNYYNNLMISDMVALLDKKGFNQFYSMHLKEDCLVYGQQYFRFNYKYIRTFCFTANTNIEEDYYYEFK